MTKKEFLKELEKSFGEVGEASKDTDVPGKVQKYCVWVGDSDGNLFDAHTLYFFVENEGTPQERAFVPHPHREEQEKFQEEFDEKVDSLQLSAITKNKFVKELKKFFGKVSGTIMEEPHVPGKIQEYWVSVGESDGDFLAEGSLHFFVENEGTSEERAFVPHPDKEKQEQFKEEFRKKIELFRLS